MEMGETGNAGRIAICDSELCYGERLLEYLKIHLPFPCELELYTGAQRLQERCSEGICLLVISEREFEKMPGEKRKEPVLILNESGKYLGEQENSISKYQSIDGIARMVRELVMRQSDVTPGMIRHGGKCRIIGCYTPLTRCLQTTFALMLGQLLARKHKVLYLNFENYSGLDRMLGRSFHGSVADLLYYNECAREKLTGQLALLVENLNGLDFLPPMKSFLELKAVQKDQWISLFHSIEEVTDYEYILLDLSESVEGLFPILRECGQIFTIVREDRFSQAKLASYEQFLKAEGCEDIAARTRRISFPVFRELPAAMENLTHGEMADLVRKMANEEGYDVN